jgi:hypothetical protein
MRSILGALALCWSLPMPGRAQQLPALMPLPAEIGYQPGKFRLDTSFTIAAPGFADDRLRSAIGRALDRLEGMIGQPLGKSLVAESRFTVQVGGPGERVQSPDEDEAYTLEV